MSEGRNRPPHDISPEAFFIEWVPRAIASDPERSARLGSGAFSLQFEIEGDGGGVFCLEVEEGMARGRVGAHEAPHLLVRVDFETWRELNRGDVSAPQALLSRRVRLQGDLRLAVRLHVILG